MNEPLLQWFDLPNQIQSKGKDNSNMAKEKQDLYQVQVENIDNITGHDGRMTLISCSVPNWSEASRLPEDVVNIEAGISPMHERVLAASFTYNKAYDVAITIRHLSTTKEDDPRFIFIMKVIPLSDNSFLVANMIQYTYLDYESMEKILKYLMDKFGKQIPTDALDGQREFAPICNYEFRRRCKKFRFDTNSWKEVEFRANGKIYFLKDVQVDEHTAQLTFDDSCNLPPENTGK